ncbi:MAG: prokaryotic ubiquitin-like protein Pup [Actinomycetota bacterium]|jgi:ubiquitin-like protein Pup
MLTFGTVGHMQERVQKGREAGSRTEDAVGGAHSTVRGDQIKSDLDDILDEIDEVLEENAEEFVRNYVQKGGQ